MISILTRAGTALYARPNTLLVLTALFWSGNVIAGQLAKDQITPMQMVLLRWVAVTLIIWPIWGRQVVAHWRVAKAQIWRIAAMAFLGFTGFNVLFYVASLRTEGVNVGILQGAMPVAVLLGAMLAHGTRVSGVQAAGVVCTLIGVVVVATKGAPHLLGDLAVNSGDLIMLASISLYAAYAVLLQSRPAMPGAVFFAMMVPIAMLTALPPAVIEWAVVQPPWPTWKGLLLCAYVTLFPSLLAQLFFMRGVDLIGSGRAGVYINLVPVFAAILSVLLLGEAFYVYHAIALLLVIGGILLAQRAPKPVPDKADSPPDKAQRP